MKTKEDKHTEAREREAAHEELSPVQRIAKLDAKLGPGVGAKKERARLMKLMED